MSRAHQIDEKKFAIMVAELWRLRQERTAMLSRTSGPPLDELISVTNKIQAVCAALAT